MNIEIEQFYNALTQQINASPLPLGVIRLIFKDALHQIDELYNQQLQQEQNELLTAQKKEEAE